MNDPTLTALLSLFGDLQAELDPDDAPTRKHRSEDVYAKRYKDRPALRIKALCRVLDVIDRSFWVAKAEIVRAANEERISR